MTIPKSLKQIMHQACNKANDIQSLKRVRCKLVSANLKGSSQVDNRQLDEEANECKQKSFIANRLKRQLKCLNPIIFIKVKMLIFVISLIAAACLLLIEPAQAGFMTFYFPNIMKPKGFSELSTMISGLEAEINETKDAYADIRYFWGQLQALDKVENRNDYPEESACSDVFPLFRDLAIRYIQIDYEYYLKPRELYLEHLESFRTEWYPGGIGSKAALPREWEQKLMEKELQLKIEWLEKLTNRQIFRDQRKKMVDIWKTTRRSLDTSLPCIYFRYGYRIMAEDLNQMALEANLDSMVEAMKVLVAAYTRIATYKASDKRIIEDIDEELKKLKRYTINQ